MPVAVVVGIALHSLMDGKLRYSIVFTLVTVGIMFGALFMWLLGVNLYFPVSSVHNSNRN